MAQLRDALTDKILIFGYLEQADTPFPIYTILCKYCNINSKETIAIGDDYNDVPMFQEVGLAIAMGNANDDVKAKADLVTKTNNEDGVAFILEKLIQDF